MWKSEENLSGGWSRAIVLSEYKKYLLIERDVRDETASVRCAQANRFLEHVFQDREFDIKSLDFFDVTDFFNTGIKGPKKITGSSVPPTIKVFLRFLYRKNITQKNLADIVPKIRQRRYATYNRSLDWVSAKDLLAAIPRDGEAGSRNYAMVASLLLAGLRSREAINLKTSYIDWKNSELEVHGKNDVFRVVPLNETLAQAYFQYIRKKKYPKTEFLFVSLNDHCSPLKNTRAIRDVLHLAYTRSGVEPPNGCRGAHALRHSFARRLTSQNTAITTIAQLMGHEDINSSMIYARSDISSLMKIAPEWPNKW